MPLNAKNSTAPSGSPGGSANSAEVVLRYHEATKHDFHRYAPSLGYLDWATQPHPFRRFDGAPLTRLLLPDVNDTPPYEALYGGTPEAAAVDLPTLSKLFYFSMSVSAWKKLGDSQWALRVNPSSGNLHPTEAYLICGTVGGLCDGPAVHHYTSDVHGLERRCDLDVEAWGRLSGGLRGGAFLLALTSIHWREAWKYGARAYRYCQHDAGHALAALRMAAALLGWSLRLLTEISRPRIGAFLGLDRPDGSHDAEAECADILLLVEPPTQARRDAVAAGIADVPLPGATRWYGRANRLSVEHHPWTMIEQVEQAVAADLGPGAGAGAGLPVAAASPASPAQEVQATSANRDLESPDRSSPPDSSASDTLGAGRILRRRRSAVAMDGRTGMSCAAFLRMLGRLLPDATPSPWDAVPWRACVHLGLFVHRVEDLAPGLYVLVRNQEHEDLLRSTMNESFDWRRPDAVPAWFPLFQLAQGDIKSVAKRVSCDQDIAADGAFSAGMLAFFEPMVTRHGAACYPQLFWETGVIGQVLYLEAEAAGLRATGIGCFFDDPVHQVFGLRDRTFQSLYHFTVGGAVDDPRLTTLPAYG